MRRLCKWLISRVSKRGTGPALDRGMPDAIKAPRLTPSMIADLQATVDRIHADPEDYALHQYGAVTPTTLDWVAWRRRTMEGWLAEGAAPVDGFNLAMDDGWTL